MFATLEVDFPTGIMKGNMVKCRTVCSYYVTYALQSESTLYICLDVNKLLAQNRRDI